MTLPLAERYGGLRYHLKTTNRYRGGQREEDRWEVNAFLRRPEG
jgi:hypothetical protein